MIQRIYCTYVPAQFGSNYAQLVLQLLKCFFTQLVCSMCFFTQLVCSMSQVLKGCATETAAFLWADKQIGKVWINAQSSNSHNLKRASFWIDVSQLLKSYTWSQNEYFYEINPNFRRRSSSRDKFDQISVYLEFTAIRIKSRVMRFQWEKYTIYLIRSSTNWQHVEDQISKPSHKLIYSLGNTRTLEACISRNSYNADSDIHWLQNLTQASSWSILTKPSNAYIAHYVF